MTGPRSHVVGRLAFFVCLERICTLFAQEWSYSSAESQIPLVWACPKSDSLMKHGSARRLERRIHVPPCLSKIFKIAIIRVGTYSFSAPDMVFVNHGLFINCPAKVDHESGSDGFAPFAIRNWTISICRAPMANFKGVWLVVYPNGTPLTLKPEPRRRRAISISPKSAAKCSAVTRSGRTRLRNFDRQKSFFLLRRLAKTERSPS